MTAGSVLFGTMLGIAIGALLLLFFERTIFGILDRLDGLGDRCVDRLRELVRGFGAVLRKLYNEGPSMLERWADDLVERIKEFNRRKL